MKTNGKTRREARREIQLAASEKQALSSLNTEHATLKIQLADLVLQEVDIVERKAELIKQIAVVSASFREKMRKIANAHDVDPDDPQRGRWMFDLRTMTLRPAD